MGRLTERQDAAHPEIHIASLARDLYPGTAIRSQWLSVLHFKSCHKIHTILYKIYACMPVYMQTHTYNILYIQYIVYV